MVFYLSLDNSRFPFGGDGGEFTRSWTLSFILIEATANLTERTLESEPSYRNTQATTERWTSSLDGLTGERIESRICLPRFTHSTPQQPHKTRSQHKTNPHRAVMDAMPVQCVRRSPVVAKLLRNPRPCKRTSLSLDRAPRSVVPPLPQYTCTQVREMTASRWWLTATLFRSALQT